MLVAAVILRLCRQQDAPADELHGAYRDSARASLQAAATSFETAHENARERMARSRAALRR